VKGLSCKKFKTGFMVSMMLSLGGLISNPLMANEVDINQAGVASQCIAEVAGRALSCTANDVVFSVSASAVIDACEYIGDTATITPAVNLSGLVSRYDIATFVALDGGDAMQGSCRANVYPDSLPFDDLEPEQPEDSCGDLEAHSPVNGFELASMTIPCLDRDQNGVVDVAACVAWSTNGSDICQAPAHLSYTGSQCSCSLQNVTGLPVPLITVEVKKYLNPSSDPGLFDLLIDQQSMATAVGDSGTTGPVELPSGVVQVGEIAAAGTQLGNYVSSIECFDRVGRCSLDATARCISDQQCTSQQDETCNLTPTLMASCTNCTSLPLALPSAPTAVQCSITNTAEEAPGRIRIVKQTIPDGDPTDFQFSASYVESDFSLSDGQQHPSGSLVPGTYSVSESLPEGWILDSVSCSDGSAPSAIMLVNGEEVVCTFYNRREDIHADGFENESS
jgi:hypothetical protein